MKRPPHAFPVWDLYVPDDDAEPDESLATALVGTAILALFFIVVFFVIAPALA